MRKSRKKQRPSFTSCPFCANSVRIERVRERARHSTEGNETRRKNGTTRQAGLAKRNTCSRDRNLVDKRACGLAGWWVGWWVSSVEGLGEISRSRTRSHPISEIAQSSQGFAPTLGVMILPGGRDVFPHAGGSSRLFQRPLVAVFRANWPRQYVIVSLISHAISEPPTPTTATCQTGFQFPLGSHQLPAPSLRSNSVNNVACVVFSRVSRTPLHHRARLMPTRASRGQARPVRPGAGPATQRRSPTGQHTNPRRGGDGPRAAFHTRSCCTGPSPTQAERSKTMDVTRLCRSIRPALCLLPCTVYPSESLSPRHYLPVVFPQKLIPSA